MIPAPEAVPAPDRPSRLIGVDLGGSQLRAALVEAGGRLVASRRLRTDTSGPEAVVAQMCSLIEELRGPGAVAIGIGIPGTLEPDTGTVLNIPALPGWRGVPLAALLARATGLPCRLENDAKCAALGEWHAGAGRGCENFVYVTISTGIGGGIVADGRLLRGVGGLAGEVGHTKISDDPERCACGLTGCWQAIASGTALGRRAARALSTNPGSRLNQLPAGTEVSAEHVGAAARAGDALALTLLSDMAVFLGMGFANIQHAYSPEKIVVGGGVSAILDLMHDRIAAVLRERILPGFRPAAIVPAALADHSGLIGAAMLADRF